MIKIAIQLCWRSGWISTTFINIIVPLKMGPHTPTDGGRRGTIHSSVCFVVMTIYWWRIMHVGSLTCYTRIQRNYASLHHRATTTACSEVATCPPTQFTYSLVESSPHAIQRQRYKNLFRWKTRKDALCQSLQRPAPTRGRVAYWEGGFTCHPSLAKRISHQLMH